MLSYDEIMNLTTEEFCVKWRTNEIQDSALKLIGERKMTEEDKKELKLKEVFEF